MRLRAYLPSGQFALLAASIAGAGVLIYGALALTSPHSSQAHLDASEAGSAGGYDWQKEFNSGNSLVAQGQALNTQAQALINEAQTRNLTDTLGRSLLIQTAAAQGQGLGSDVPTQDQIVSNSLSQIANSQQYASLYTSSAIPTVSDSDASLHAYGNALVSAIQAHPQASNNSVMLAVGLAVDNQSTDSLQSLGSASSEYRALAKEVAGLETPTSLINETLTLANNYAQMAQATEQMQTLISDPVAGLAALQHYVSLSSSDAAVFTRVAQALQKNDILFTKQEPGSTWASFLDAVTQAQAAQAQNQSAAAPTSP